jgi:hypothetical protein
MVKIMKLVAHPKNPQKGFWTGPPGMEYRKGTKLWAKYYMCPCKERVIMRHQKNPATPTKVGALGRVGS